jgi:hypothetical protein
MEWAGVVEDVVVLTAHGEQPKSLEEQHLKDQSQPEDWQRDADDCSQSNQKVGRLAVPSGCGKAEWYSNGKSQQDSSASQLQ